MKNKGILIIIAILAIAIVALVFQDIRKSRIEKRSGGDFVYDVEAYKKVSPTLISHKETRQLLLDCSKPGGVFAYNNTIYFTADDELYIIAADGKQEKKLAFHSHINDLVVNDDGIYLLYDSHLEAYSHDKELVFNTEQENEKSVFTSLVLKDGAIFVADAGNKRILRYHTDGNPAGEFEGTGAKGEDYGFIIPSAYFDMDVNGDNELWIVNTGIHTMQHYSGNGELKSSWKQTGINIEGFAGCCNPAHFAFLPDGRYITSEKGMVRVKIYDQKGNFESVVAAPEKFMDNGHAPDVAALDNNTILLLDYDKKMLRFFEQVEK